MSSTANPDPSARAQPEELRTSTRLLSLIYDSTSEPVYLVRLEQGGLYRFVSVNESFLRVSGYRVDQVIGAPMERVVPKANVGLVRSQYERAIAARQPIIYEERADLPAGTRYAEITLIPIFEGHGPVTHILGDIRDITARRQAEMERERLLDQALFLSGATRLLTSLDIEHALRDVARLAMPYLADGCAIDLFGGNGPRRIATVALDPRHPMSVELHPTVLGGHPLIYPMGFTSCLGVPVLVHGQLAGAITLRAPEHRKYTAADLELVEELARRAAMAIDNARLYRRAQDALRARDEFLTAAAHEIREPVASIHLVVQTLLQKKLPEDQLLRLLQVVEREDRRLSRFVDELLDVGHVRAGRFAFQLEEVDLAEVANEVVKRLRGEPAGRGLPLTITVEPNVLGEWDRFRVEQVVTNLLSNAIKFGLGKPIEITVAKSGDRARLRVVDHGVGIEPADRERIFEFFERSLSGRHDGGPGRHDGGLGIGLHIVKTIVAAMGGTVEVESQPGAGSTFTVQLPLRATARGESD
jgi:PAS domain S-box-containing protein